MEQRLSLVTLAVADVAAARAFYVDGLGWSPFHDGEGIVMIQVGQHLLLSLWNIEEYRDEVGSTSLESIPPITLAHNVASDPEVDRVIEQMVASGGELVESGTTREWGGYSGYVADPNGYRWEIAHAPGELGELTAPPDGAMGTGES